MATEAAVPTGGATLPSVGARAAGLRVELLGGFRAAVDGQPVPDGDWRLRRSREVVALLALAHGHRLHRDEVVDLLWPDENPASRANSLHQVLHVARRALDRERPRRFLHLQGDLIALTDGDRVMVDVLELEAQASAARRSATVVEWTRIAEASSLELLPECRYAEWSAARRRDVEALHREAVAALAEALHAAGETHAAATVRERIATLDGGAPTHAAAPPGAPGVVANPEPPREHNLPRYISSFVGRDRQLGELDGLLERNRLLTLSGPGGAGKTRLACELARRALPRLRGGAWFTDLGAVSDASLVLAAVAEALAVRPRPGDTLLGVVRSRLRQGPCLLLLDNCEHLLGACAEYAESLLRDCPELTVLATSREPLRVAGEVVWRTPSLVLPAPATRTADLAGAEAVALLVDRAVAVDPSFTLDESNAADVSRLCHRLDGLPLAIELAAARLRTLSPAQLVERLDERFRLLSAGSRTALTRQQTLAATLDWSHDLLDEPQRAVFRRLSVFAGGFELEAAEAACAAPPVAREEVASLLADLAEKSLVGVEPRRAGRRYRLLETIRAYGRGRLATAGELEETARRHAEWCAALAERAEPMLSSRDEALWLDRLESDHDNLIAALVWALDRDPPLVGRLAAGLGRYWLRRLRLSEGIRWLDAALEGVPDDGLLRARLLVARTAIDIRRWGHSAELAGAVEQSARIASRHGDHLLEGTALLLSGSHQLLSALTGAPAGFRLALEVGLREGLEELAAAAVACLAVAEVYSGEDATAAAHLEEALDRLQVLSRRGAGSVRVPCLISIGEVVGPRFEVGGRTRMILEETVVPYRDLGLEEAAAHVTAMQGVLERMRGEIDGAERRLREAHRRFRHLGDERGVAETLARGGNLALSVGDTATAGRRLRAARRLHHRRGDPRGEGLTLTALGSTALGEGRAEEGRRLLDAAWTLFTRAGDRPGIVNTLVHRGDHALMTGDLDAAEERYSSITGQQRAQAWVQFYLADVAEARGDAGAALVHLLEARRDIGALFGRRAVAACEARIAAFSA